MLPPKESNVDVLIIGAGPSGLFCANGLAKAGVNVRIIDKRPLKIPAGQADGIQPRTIEVLQSYGLAERLLREGNQMHMAAFYNPSPNGGIERTDRAADINTTSARYPFEITLHQGAIESIFLDSMTSLGVTVDRPVIPTSIELSENESELANANSYPVKIVLKRLDAADNQYTEIVHAKYVVGADGAHSWVRKALGIDMDGEQTDYIWGVVDMIPETDFPDIRCKAAVHSENGSCMVIPREGDIVRLYIQLTDSDVLGADGRVDKTKMGPEKLMEVAQKSFHPFTITASAFDWWTIYIIGQRVASKFSMRERVFIAGDACHTHSPKAGQGMNASMNDTHNLIWKLTYVLRGWADPSLLQTYEFERQKYAQDLINFDKEFSALFSGKPKTEENRDGVSHEEFLKAFLTFGAFTSGIGIHYAPSAIVNTVHQSLASNLIIGQRMLPQVFVRCADARPFEIQDLLPADTRFKVLLFAGDTTKQLQMQRVRAFADSLAQESAWFKRFGGADPWKVFDILTISAGSKHDVSYTDFPKSLCPHWSRVLLDDRELYPRGAGNGYEAYGIDRTQGAVVIVRPDGYVGMIVPIEGVQDIADYFCAFMKAS